MRSNWNNSIGRGGDDAWSATSATSIDCGYGSTISGRAGSDKIQSTPSSGWFEPIVDELSDCPGGICPVPWATKERSTLIDNVDHPEHYNSGSIECIEAIEAQLTPEEYRGYLKGNVAKYVWREKHKGGIESLKKANWYLNRLMNLE